MCLGGAKLFRKETRCTFYARNRQHVGIFDFAWFLSRLWRANCDVGFVIGFVVGIGFRLCSVWGVSVAFVAYGARKRDVGFDSVWNGFGFWGFVSICDR